MTPSDAELRYYATPAPMTDIASCPSLAFDGLPDSAEELVTIARRSITVAPPGTDDRGEPRLRRVSTMIERILALDPSPLVERRPQGKRIFGTCRHFATLACALFRHKNMPARVRAGFAGYFTPNTWADHWILEYWRASEERWVRVDPQWGDGWARTRFADATSESLAGSMYLSGGEAWQQCRNGSLDPNRCNMGGTNWGIGEVRGSVLYDLAALNKVEVLPWDVWGQMEAAYNNVVDDAYDALLDSISDITKSGAWAAIREAYETNELLRVPATIIAPGNGR